VGDRVANAVSDPEGEAPFIVGDTASPDALTVTADEGDDDKLADNDAEAAGADEDAVLLPLTVALGVGDRVANAVSDPEGEAPFIVADTASPDALTVTAGEGDDDKLADNDAEAAGAEGEGVAETDAVLVSPTEEDMDRLSEDD
jgi:hypothetical protein